MSQAERSRSSQTEFRWPRTDQHATIIGMNGSGKSVFAAHLVSSAPIDVMPYVVIDFKREDLFNSIDRARYLKFSDDVPRESGLYILHAEPEVDDEKVNNFLYKILKRGRCGVVYDEAFSVPKGAMNTIFMQGRSKHIPCITVTQRPVYLTRYAFTEASYFAMFRLNDTRDQETIKSWVPPRDPVWDMKRVLPEYHARWYDTRQNSSFVLSPAPDPERILDKFDYKLHKPRKVL